MTEHVTLTKTSAPQMTDAELDQLCINCIRTLSIDAVQQAKSGQPGTWKYNFEPQRVTEVAKELIGKSSKS